MNPKTSIDDLNVSGKKVLIRVDFNVPVQDGEISNDYRIRSSIPTIRKVIDQGGSAILMSHLGRPEGVAYPGATQRVQNEFSLRPVAARLQEILRSQDADVPPVLFADDCCDADAHVERLAAGQVLLLENVRFYKNESSKDADERDAMAAKLAGYGDLYVSDAFGTAHRNSATMTGIPAKLGQGAAGYLMAREIDAFSSILNDPPRPVVAIVGGSKVTDKIQLLENMIEKIDKLLIGGAMAYTFLKAQGFEIGNSFSQAGQMFKGKDGKEVEITELAKQLLAKAADKGVEVCLPLDHLCSAEFKAPEKDGDVVTTTDANVPEGVMALDIGPKTVALYESKVRESKAAIWNGPMGVFEIDAFSNGTFAIAKVMGDETESNDMLTIIGGGDSASAAELSGHAKRMSHVSTGGGASLELLEGKQLPGIVCLDDK